MKLLAILVDDMIPLDEVSAQLRMVEIIFTVTTCTHYVHLPHLPRSPPTSHLPPALEVVEVFPCKCDVTDATESKKMESEVSTVYIAFIMCMHTVRSHPI